MHPRSGGHGIDGLQHGGSTIIWFGATSDLELYSQTNARLRRSGQSNPVFVHRLILANTLEDSVLKSLEGKDNFQTALLNGIKEIKENAKKN
jgi:SNF2 family DNA or RNA helicase